MSKKNAPSDSSAKLYTTLEKAASAEFTEKKSLFIGSASPCKNVEEAVAFVNGIRAKYPDATHNVYAYLLGSSVTRYSDDGEPSGTAGMPVLDVIRKSGFTDAAIVVTRYFGGILLGAGGLVRAYTTAAKSAVAEAHIVTYMPYTVFTLTLGYSDYQRAEPILARYEVKRDSVAFAGEVTAVLAVQASVFEPLRAALTEATAARAVITSTGERYDK